jgi:glucosamine--fructose-6-phosphate aminotransferase (isomerizing)
LRVLAALLNKEPLMGCIGIAHTRWATHGRPSEGNAHPHLSHNEVAIVHNGIIENHDELRRYLQDLNYQFTSETDSEVAAHLIHYHYQQTQDLLQAVQLSAQQMRGAFALGVIHADYPNEIAVYRRGSPLVIGLGLGENMIASDPLAFQSLVPQVVFLEEGDSALITQTEVHIFDHNRQGVQRTTEPLNEANFTVSKEPYPHFMLKEILEQGAMIAETLAGRLSNLEVLRATFGDVSLALWQRTKRVHIVACGTSYHAGLIAKFWFESLSGLSTQVEVASQYRYRDVLIEEATLFLTISQSGETADTIAALIKAKTLGYVGTFAICNVANSTLVRQSDAVFLTRAGIEIGVASTKAFTTQLVALLMIATILCKDTRAEEVLNQLQSLSTSCDRASALNPEIEQVAHQFANTTNALFLGRGIQFPVALEGALKLKEVSYIHAEAFPAGELKHGPLALVDTAMPVIVIAPSDELLDKLKSNLHEVSARGGVLFVLMDEGEEWSPTQVTVIRVPSCGSWVAPIVYTLPLQLLAYHVAVIKGTDVDQPRNLAKSVTVE